MGSLQLVSPADWTEYRLLDSGDGYRLEKFGQYTIARPDPQVLWPKTLPPEIWNKADAFFERTREDKGQWSFRRSLPEEWILPWRDVNCAVKPTPYKHMGVFPEQSAHWAWMHDILTQAKTQPQVLNLFAYTGMASVVAAKAGAKVTHVDASRAAIGWAKKNQEVSNLPDDSIRWILDDVMKFVAREVRRGTKYDGIIMDPPVYGHGPKGERWEFKTLLPELLDMCQQLMSDRPLFVLVNAYAVSISALTLGNVLSSVMASHEGQVTQGELTLLPENGTAELSTGIWARWTNE
jgi:23S rRNA (cytosine1962-C5)-methyltransferase